MYSSDEASSALDEGLEHAMYGLLRESLHPANHPQRWSASAIGAVCWASHTLVLDCSVKVMALRKTTALLPHSLVVSVLGLFSVK